MTKIALHSGKEAVSSLAERLKDYRPKAVVALLLAIEPMVVGAIQKSGLSCAFYGTPYPGFGNQPRFHSAMAEIIPNLPTLSGNPWKEQF